MDDYFARFGAVRDYLASVVAEARKDGYTETIVGRRRYLPDLNSTNRQRREMAERMALNAPDPGQCGGPHQARDARRRPRLADEGLKSRQLLQVHDELVLEVAAGGARYRRGNSARGDGGAAELDASRSTSTSARASNWRVAGH